jgi:ribosomal protein L40E
MDPVLLSLIQLGLKVGSDLLALKTQKSKDDYTTFLKNTSKRVEDLIQSSNQSLIRKIENDKLEQLDSRIRNLSTLISLNKESEALEYAMQLKESVDYARNRLREGKEEWLGAYLTGQSVYVSALLFSKAEVNENDLLNDIKDLLFKTRIQLLNNFKSTLLASENTPWIEIHSFISGDSDALISTLISEEQNNESKEIPKKISDSIHQKHFGMNKIFNLDSKELLGESISNITKKYSLIEGFFSKEKSTPKFCRKCGNKLEKDSSICSKCGEKTI